MGLVKLPWVDEGWFVRTTFNYCDHFGDKKILAKMCIICHDEVERYKRYKKLGIDPNDLSYALKEITKSLRLVRKQVAKKAEELGVDLSNLGRDQEDLLPVEKTEVYKVIEAYGLMVAEFLVASQSWVEKCDGDDLLQTVINVLIHSRFYMLTKTARAILSKWEEGLEPGIPEDSKTSGFLAYLAVSRNCQALKAFIRTYPGLEYTISAQTLLDCGEDICQLLRLEFFPNESMKYKEWGCDHLISVLNT